MNPLDGPDYAYSALNGLTRGPDGTITYDFDGHIKAQGLDLDMGVGGIANDDQRIIWTRQGDGAALATLTATQGSFDPDTNSATWDLDGVGEFNRAQLGLNTGNGTGESTINASISHPTLGAKVATILRSDGASSFLQLASAAERRRVAFGAVTVTWNGTSASAPFTVFPGFAPATVLAISGPMFGHTAVQAQNVTGFSFDLVATSGGVVANGTQSLVYWLAIG